ncbi:hypothetical protein C8Q78DRAFT_1155806 [Trametes maxima]|nr:hypothetical protein C8Q78DRAFT_1155806 [Trametes maxima]
MGNCFGRCWRKAKSSVLHRSVQMHPNVPHVSPTHNVEQTLVQTLPCSESQGPPVHTGQRPTPLKLTMPQSDPSLPPRDEFIPFTVPNLCVASPYDELDFMTFPDRHGWRVHRHDKRCHPICPPGFCSGGSVVGDLTPNDDAYSAALSRADGTPVTSAEKVAFLQSWLFFGTLYEMSRMCGLDFNDALPGGLVAPDGSYVSTAALNGLAGRWFASLNREQVGDKAFMGRILSILRLMSLLLNEELGLEDDTDPDDYENRLPAFEYTPDQARVYRALDILLRVLGLHLLLHVYSPGFSCSEAEGWSKGMVTESIDWARGRRLEGSGKLEDYCYTFLEDLGWCESELPLLGGDELFFASLLDRPRTEEIRHSACGEIVCSAYQTNEATYKTAHVDNSCHCGFMCTATNELTSLLGQNKIPAVVIREDLGLDVVDASGYPYIAISHVWADGLGNAGANGLPRCQLRRLRDHVNRLYTMHCRESSGSCSAPAFWIDTLCVPVDKNAKEFRKKAIQLLGETYYKAIAVLVLDKQLESVDGATAPFLEFGLRILSGGWIKRLWTLQEATLASEVHGEEKIYFQMLDGPVLYCKYNRHRPAARPVGTIASSPGTEIGAEERTLLYDRSVMHLLGDQLPSANAMRDLRAGWHPLAVVYAAIEHRTTSKSEDVPLCIASLLGMDVSTIVHAPDGSHRTRAFFLLLGTVPSGVLWAEGVDKLPMAPFRWAPASITACRETLFQPRWRDGGDGDSKGVVVCDERGLHVRYAGFMVRRLEARVHLKAIPSPFCLADADTGAHYGAMWPSGKDQGDIPLTAGTSAKLAIVVRPPTLGMYPNAAIVQVEKDFTDGNGNSEVVGTAIGYRFFSPERRGSDDVVVYCTPLPELHRWCIT